MALSRISDLTAGAVPIPVLSLLEVSVPNAGAPSGYDSRRNTLTELFTSPVMTGTPTAPNPNNTDNSTRVSTTAYVRANIDVPQDGQQYARVGSSWSPLGTTSTNTFEYRFDNSLTAGPPSGDIRLNNANPAQATAIYASKTSDNGRDVSNYLSLVMQYERIYLQVATDSTISHLWDVTGVPVDNGTYYTFPVTWNKGSGTFNNNAALMFSHVAGKTQTGMSLTAGTGLVASPSTITGVGSFALAVPVQISSGGTGATSASAALANLNGLPISGGTITGNLMVNGVSEVQGQSGFYNPVTIRFPDSGNYQLLVAGTTNAVRVLLQSSMARIDALTQDLNAYAPLGIYSTTFTVNTGTSPSNALTIAANKDTTFQGATAVGNIIPADNWGSNLFSNNIYLNNMTLGFNIYYAHAPDGWKHLNSVPAGGIWVDGGNGNLQFALGAAGSVGSPATIGIAASVSPVGNFWISGNYIYLAGAGGSVNTTGGPLIYADAGTLVLKTGSGANGVWVQNYSGAVVWSVTQSGIMDAYGQGGGVDFSPVRMTTPSNSDNFLKYNGSRTIGVGLKADGTFMIYDYSGLSTRMSMDTSNTTRLFGYTISSDFRSDGNCYVPNGFIYAGTNFQSPSTNYPTASTSVGYLTGIALRFIQNPGDEGSSGSISSRVHDGGALCVVGVGTNGTNRRVKIWDVLDMAGRINTPYIWSSGDAQFDGHTYFGGGGQFRLFNDGNAHIESSVTLWLNHDTNQDVRFGDGNSGRALSAQFYCVGGNAQFVLGSRSGNSEFTLYNTSNSFRIYADGADKWQVQNDGVVYNHNHLVPTVDNQYWCGVDAWTLSWYVVSCYNAHNPSDRRLKRDIEDLPDCLKIVDKLSPRRYFMINDPEEEKWRRHWGFVAQEVGEVMDAAGYDFDSGYYRATNPYNGEEVHSLNYNDIVACLWKAVQELSAKVKHLEARIPDVQLPKYA